MSVGVRVATSEVPSSCQLPIPATLKARGSWCRLRRLRFLPGSSCVRGCPAANWSGRGRCRSGSSTRAGSFALAGCVERSGYGRPVATQAVYYRSSDGVEPVAEFLDREFPLEPRKKSPSVREIEAAATKRMTVDLQIDRLNGLASDDPPLPFPATSQIDGPLRLAGGLAGSASSQFNLAALPIFPGCSECAGPMRLSIERPHFLRQWGARSSAGVWTRWGHADWRTDWRTGPFWSFDDSATQQKEIRL